MTRPVGRPSGPPRLVLVDPHTAVRRNLRGLLEDQGILVVADVGTDAEARDVVRDQRPDVVLVDQHLDGGTGLDLCRHLRLATPCITCILHVSMLSDELNDEARSAGVTFVVLKSLKDSRLASTVRAAAAN